MIELTYLQLAVLILATLTVAWLFIDARRPKVQRNTFDVKIDNAHVDMIATIILQGMSRIIRGVESKTKVTKENMEGLYKAAGGAKRSRKYDNSPAAKAKRREKMRAYRAKKRTLLKK